MKHDKDYYRAKAPKGWRWGGAGDYPHTHFFQKGDYGSGFRVLECSEGCLENGDLEFLASHGMTCTKERLKKMSRAIEKRIQKEEVKS